MGYNLKMKTKYNIKMYQTENNKVPFIIWLESVKDKQFKARIKIRLDRLRLGNFGDYKSIEQNLYELRFTFGAGYRVYFGKENDNLVILLCGGDKKSQKMDIKNAKLYWNDYLTR